MGGKGSSLLMVALSKAAGASGGGSRMCSAGMAGSVAEEGVVLAERLCSLDGLREVGLMLYRSCSSLGSLWGVRGQSVGVL